MPLGTSIRIRRNLHAIKSQINPGNILTPRCLQKIKYISPLRGRRGLSGCEMLWIPVSTVGPHIVVRMRALSADCGLPSKKITGTHFFEAELASGRQLDWKVIHRPVFNLKHDVSETEFVSLSLYSTSEAIYTWRRLQNIPFMQIALNKFDCLREQANN